MRVFMAVKRQEQKMANCVTNVVKALRKEASNVKVVGLYHNQ